MNVNNRQIISTTIGITMIAFGVSQIVKPREWVKYIPTKLEDLLPLDNEATMKVHGSGNVLLGVALLSQLKPTLIRSSAGVWWLWVALFCGRYDCRIAARDIAIGITLLGSISKNDE